MSRVSARMLWPVGVGGALLALWQVASAFDPTQARLVPGPLATVRAAARLLQDSMFWLDLAVSVERMAIGTLVSAVIAVPLGVGLALSPVLRLSSRWIVDALRYTPVTAFIPLLVLFLGIGEWHKVAVVVLGTAPYTAVLTASALTRVPREIIDSARTLGVSRLVILRRFYLPYAAPDILTALRVTTALAWTYLLTAELVGATRGVGQFLIQAQRFLRSEDVLVAVIVIGVIGWMSDVVFRTVQRRAFPWAVLRSDQRGEAIA